MADPAPSTPPEPTALSGENAQHHHHLHTGKRLRKFLRPNGRRVHIAATPEEHVRLKNTLPNIEPDENFDLFLHGSDDHLKAVREIHAHHEQRKQSLRVQHGTVYDDIEQVRDTLDHLSEELHMLTDHGVSLDANFSKFGFDAHIRTRDPDSSSNSVSERSSSVGEKRDWNAEKSKGTAIKFYRKPVVRQYFHKGLLWRASQVEEVASFELFVDLLYVGIIAVIGDNAAENANGFGLLRFCITFILGWKMWSDLTLVISWFEVDDVIQRISVLFIMICLFGYTLNIIQAFESTWTQLVAFYLTQRLFNAGYYLWICYVLPMVRGYMVMHIVTILVPAALWIASIQLEYPHRLAIIWVAIWLDLFGMTLFVFFKRWAEKEHPEKVARTIEKYFDFFPAINIEHKTERTNAFVTLVFGYSVVALLFQNKAAFGINAFFGKAVLGLIQAFAFNWIYFEIDAYNVHTHAIRRHYASTWVWLTAHLPFIMSYVLAGAALSRLVLATDCRNANVEDLTETYAVKSEHEISSGLRWYYCGGLAVALLCMSAISLSHVHKDIQGQRLSKIQRLPLRVAIAITILCLPLAESLTSLTLVATTTGLVVIILIYELYGSTNYEEGFWKCKRQYKYSADCRMRKKILIDKLKNGETVKLEEVQAAVGGDDMGDGLVSESKRGRRMGKGMEKETFEQI